MIAGAVLFFIIVLVSMGIFVGLKINKRYESEFKLALHNLNPEYMKFYRRLYASCTCNGFRIYFSYAALEKSFPVILPGRYSISIIIRTKIPGTENVKLHLAVFHEDKNKTVRKAAAWSNPEPDFYTGKISGQSAVESVEVFNRLSQSTKNVLKTFAEKCGSCAITPDWETVIIGAENSLRLAGGDKTVLQQLDFQIIASINISGGEIMLLLDEITAAVKLISGDLGK